ncbi:hypothetical protein ES708_23811 [subsurface metagenome]
MKRRDAIKLVPISIAGLTGIASNTFGGITDKKAGDVGSGKPLAVRYSEKVKDRLTWIRENQSDSLMEAAYAIARTVENGGQCYQYSWDAGHTEADSWADRNGEPEIFSTDFSIDKAKAGDLMLASGQLTIAEELVKKKVYIIGCPSSWSGDARYPELLQDDIRKMKLRPYSDLFIENRATSLGGVINIPGMPAPIGPVSGIVGKTTIWMMLADACRILAGRGISVPVKGDEPKVTGEEVDWQNFSGWVKLGEPLMDNYFNEVMNQMELLFAELGQIRKIGEICAETALNGGIVYGYSRYNSVAGEASTRRSGLTLTQGVSSSQYDPTDRKNGFPGNDKDFVIMGITRPDDEIDLQYLDMFKKRGIQVASLGAMTRSHSEPDGRTVPKETDIHAGKMCDTYGLFAVPGFDQRICPTSGVLLDHLYWTTMMSFVESYIDKSGGDIPGVYLSGALKGGMEHLYRMKSLYSN